MRPIKSECEIMHWTRKLLVQEELRPKKRKYHELNLNQLLYTIIIVFLCKLGLKLRNHLLARLIK